MTDRIRTTTRSLTEELLALNATALSWQIDQNKHAEKQLASLFEANRTTVSTLADLQRDAMRAWLDLVAPAPAAS